MTSGGPGAPGRFIVLEGIDGSGTTTQTTRLVDHLSRTGRPAVATREPSAGPIGRLLRAALLGEHGAVDGRAMALLFAADRIDHLAREIEPHLRAGTVVVSDRYVLSSLAYQAEEADLAWVRGLARGIRMPDLTLLIDLPAEEAARRRAAAGRPDERYDALPLQRNVAANYRALARETPGARIIDGACALDAVTAAITAAVDDFLAGAT